ncbi:MAG: hypothetical protein ACYC3I_16395 [Gemmataceae bacterium]
MATNLSKVLKHLHHLLAPPGGDQTDGELLACFVSNRDEASFAALMRRHGPMVQAEADQARFHAALLDVAEAALKVLRESRDTETQRKAADALDKVLKQLDVQMKKPDSGKR